MLKRHFHDAQGTKPTDQTLAQQLQISEREIQTRMDLLDFTSDDANLLTALAPLAEENLNAIVDRFYDRQLQSPEIALVIGDAETLNRLRGSMRRYIMELFEGYYDAEYVNKRLRIGKVHQRIGVSPKLYVSALSLLETILLDTLIPLDDADGNLKLIESQRQALHKVMMFDMQLVFDTYIASLVNEVETAKHELEEYTVTLEDAVHERTAQLKDIASRDELTGLFNQRGIHEHLRRELAVAERSHEILSLVYFDLNDFKALNDTHGHHEGDRLLMALGQSLLSSVRDIDLAGRCGGDEFCIILPRTDVHQALKVFRRIEKAFDAIKPHNVTFSSGIVQTGPETHDHNELLMKRADTLMYEAKARSKKTPGRHVTLLQDHDVPDQALQDRA